MVLNIEEGRAVSKSPHSKFGYYLSVSQQGISANVIQKKFSCWKLLPKKKKEQRQKQLLAFPI